MLTETQVRFRDGFLPWYRQKIYYFRNLPMALLSGVSLVRLDEKESVSVVPFRWRNRNPFASMYFAVQSMAAELSTAAALLLAIKGCDDDIAFIIVETEAEFSRKAKTSITFTCVDYDTVVNALALLHKTEDTTLVKLKTVGRDAMGEQVATFHFTWSLKRRS